MRSLLLTVLGGAVALTPLALAQESAPAAAPAVSAEPASPDAPGPRADWRTQRGQGFSADAMLQRLDANGDGVVHVSELGDTPRAQRWAEADANGDGVLASAEVDAVRQQWRTTRGERQGEGPRESGRRGQDPQAAPPTPEG